jgi:hypothetical protein
MVQGWLQKVADADGQDRQPSAGTVLASANVPAALPTGPLMDVSLAVPLAAIAPPTWPRFEHPNGLTGIRVETDQNRSVDLVVPRAWWPMFASSALFAMAHWGQGPAPVSLFALALGLGFLFRQTGRIWPSIFVHMVLNGYSITMMLLAMAAGVSLPTGAQ